MKRIYKLIISNNEFYQEVAINSASDFDSEYRCSTALHGVGPCTIEISVLRKDANCVLHTNSEALFQDKNGITGQDVNLRCGDIVNILEPTGSRILYQCEMALAATLNDDGTPPAYDFGFGIKDDLIVGGGDNASVRVYDPLLGQDYISFIYRDNRIFIGEFNAQYGLFVNGIRTYKMCEVRNYSFITINGVHLYLKDGFIFTDSAYKIDVPSGVETMRTTASASHMAYPKFNRSTRILTVVSDEPIEILDAPTAPQKPKRNLILSLLPSLAMLILIVVVRGFMSTSTGSYVIFSACMMGVGIVTSILSFIDEKRNYKRALVERNETYSAYVERKRKEIKAARDDERIQLEQIYRDIESDIVSIKDFTSNLFDRRIDHPDFLATYLGKGNLLSARQVTYKKREKIEVSDELAEFPEQIKTDYRYVNGAPITVHLAGDNAVGIIGSNGQLYTIMKNFTVDICSRQYYRDVRLFYIINTDFADRILWLRWLPHIKNEELNARNIVCSNESKTELLEYLYILMTRRLENKENCPHIIVFVLNDIGIKTHPVSQFFNCSKDLGVTFIFFENYIEMLPEYCDEIVNLSNENSGELRKRIDSSDVISFEYTTVDDSVAAQAALKLAPVYCEEIGLENNLVKSLTFFDMLGVPDVTGLNIATNWENADVTKSLAAPIGINAKNEIVSLDIHENAHGPHGLVAGTTGSGKSELLQSYILSMAIKYHPHEVGFVIIDFKGGGMANQFKKLPHLIGTITNIDGDEINRSLLSIKAELNKRQRLFAKYNVNQIDGYIRKYKAGIATIALPHLIIVVDEFAELKADQPEFMKELISASRIGRSLGIHLILATQKPSGQVNEQIWSNSHFKLCLKVQSQGDSNEVIKSPLAAEIRETGRAYFQVGNNEVFELIQSGYSGGLIHKPSASQVDFRIAEVSLWGKKNIVYRTKKNALDVVEKTQLCAVVEVISEYCDRTNISRVQSICLPPLKEEISFVQPKTRTKTEGIIASIGVFDDPPMQYQGTVDFDVSANNLLVIGSAQYGKTNLLMTIIRSLSTKYTPTDVNLYIIDFGPSSLSLFNGLPHVGGVINDREDEKLKNLFKLLYKEIEIRKDKLLNANASSYLSYRSAGNTDLPLIVLIIDNFTALKELYFQTEDLLMPVCRNGLSVGISVIMTNSNMQGIGYRYLANFAKRVALHCNNTSEYFSLIERCRIQPKEIPGRGVIENNNRVFEFQTYLCFQGDSEMIRTENMMQYINTIKKLNNNTSVARKIPVIPTILTYEAMRETCNTYLKQGVIVIGMDYESVGILHLDLFSAGAIAVSGRAKTGKTNFMQYLAKQASLMDATVEIYIIDDMHKKLGNIAKTANVASYEIDSLSVVSLIKELETKFEAKYQQFVRGKDYAETRTLVLVSNPDAVDAISSDKEAVAAYKSLVGKYRALGFCIVFNNFENASVSYSAPEIRKMLRDNKQFLFFDDLSNFKISDIPTATLRSNKRPIELGDAYYIHNGVYERIKTIKM